MILYLKILQGGGVQYPYSLTQLKQDNPNTSFSQFISDETLAEFGVHKVQHVPSANTFGKIYVELEPLFANGVYTQRWQESDDLPGRIEILKQVKWDEIRTQRNQILKDSDFSMLEDFPQRASKLQDWKTYRQALRDITLQTDPFNITWPIKPA